MEQPESEVLRAIASRGMVVDGPDEEGLLDQGISATIIEEAIGPTDTDGDGLSAVVEELIGTDWSNADTDGDGVSDGREYNLGLDPLGEDTDQDGYPDLLEAVMDPARLDPDDSDGH